jgi:hypothetical protein
MESAILLVLVPLAVSQLGSRSNQSFFLLMVSAAGLVIFFATLIISAITLRNRSMRVLLLRPFGDSNMTSALKRVVLQYLGPLGHVYTLSDRNYRPNPLLRLSDVAGQFWRYLTSQFLRPSLRVASVTGGGQLF